MSKNIQVDMHESQSLQEPVRSRPPTRSQSQAIILHPLFSSRARSRGSFTSLLLGSSANNLSISPLLCPTVSPTSDGAGMEAFYLDGSGYHEDARSDAMERILFCNDVMSIVFEMLHAGELLTCRWMRDVLNYYSPMHFWITIDALLHVISY